MPPTTSAPTTAAPVTATTAAPTTTGFPVETNTGVRSGIVLRPWTGPDRSSAVTGLPTEIIGGVIYKVFDGYSFDTGTTGQYFSVDDPNVLFRNVRFTTSGQVSNTSAMVQQASSNQLLVIEDSEFDGGPYHQRGVQGDYGDITVRRSRFTRFGNAGVEMNNRSGTASLTVEDSYFYEPKGWNPSDHVDGIQVGGGRNVTIRHNTVLIEPYGGAAGDTSYVSNSALGLWAELGDVTGSVVVDHNLLAGGGRVIYIEQKSPYRWLGPVSVTNNVFDMRFGPNGGVWGPLAPIGLPSQLVWSGNTWSNGGADPPAGNHPISLNTRTRDPARRTCVPACAGEQAGRRVRPLERCWGIGTPNASSLRGWHWPLEPDRSITTHRCGWGSSAKLRHAIAILISFDGEALEILITHMADDTNDDLITGSTIDLGRRLGLRVVAEGVESNEALVRLRHLGCDLAQGF